MAGKKKTIVADAITEKKRSGYSTSKNNESKDAHYLLR